MTLYSYSNPNSMVLAEKDIQRSMKQNLDLRKAHIYIDLNLQQSRKSIQQRKESLFPVGKAWTVTCKRMKLDHYLILHIKVNPK